MVELYVSFWLWIGGGTAINSLWMIIPVAWAGAGSVILILFVPTLVLKFRLKARATQSVSKMIAVYTVMLVPLSLGVFFFTMYLGISGTVTYVQEFKECYQTEQQAGDYVVYERLCRTRDNIANEWSEYEPVGVSLTPVIGVELR